jgi:glycerophosphoryl diester phosphodiesterase
VAPGFDERRLPIGFAHRGARAECPENTIAAFARALDLGANGLESDAWITSDGVVVLDHDGRVGPLWRRCRIRDLRRSELPAHIPSLAELFSSCGSGFELSLDVKDPGAFTSIVEVVRAASASERLWLCHPSRELLESWRAAAPEVLLVHSTRLDGGNFDSYVVATRAGGLDVVNLKVGEWKRDLVQAAHEGGLLALAWDAQTDEVISRALDQGIDGVFSDHPRRAMEAIARRR